MSRISGARHALGHRLELGRVVAPAHHLTTPSTANQVWTADFKGQFCTGDGVLCCPFTLRHGYSR